MAMDGAHAMSMAWAPGAGAGAGASWLGAVVAFVFRAGAFEVSWTVMMAAMMLPWLAPTLWRYRQAVARAPKSPGAGGTGAGLLAAIVAAGYLAVWLALGGAVYPIGASLSAAADRWPALAHVAPFATGAVVLVGAALQFSRWKARHLGFCRCGPPRGAALPTRPAAAWRHGLRLGAHCAASSAGATAIVLAIGMMDLRAMAAVTGAVAAERLAWDGGRTARIIGGLGVGAGAVLVGRAIGLR